VKAEDRQQNNWIWAYPTIYGNNWPNPIVPGPTKFGNNWPNPIVPGPTPFG
jgi:hypothetical protein